ncbi:MAG: thiamine-phosphate kinase [Verrucomicrobiales bacterium]|nr:thiamine-phosphate kinase [Verrucomicrobiales bacterium]
MNLSEIGGEDALIDRLKANLATDPDHVIKGIGDDCAVLKTGDPEIYGLLKTDCVVEGVHFAENTAPEAVGWKAMARVLSDLAAMGGAKPVAALVTVAVEKNRAVSEIEGWYTGFRKAADRYEFSIVGGETTSLPEGGPAMISISMTGEINRESCIFRSGAQIGDLIAVSGRLGDSFESGRHLQFEPRFDLARTAAGSATAMMDLSDGLAKDLPRLATASGVGFSIDFDKVPLNGECNLEAALTDGEDYELLATFPDSAPAGFTVIGKITETIETPLKGGWDHFS